MFKLLISSIQLIWLFSFIYMLVKMNGYDWGKLKYIKGQKTPYIIRLTWALSSVIAVPKALISLML